MNRLTSRRAGAALGIGMAVAMAASISTASAQPGPRTLPANPQYQDRGPDTQQDQQFDRRNDQYRGPNDQADADRFRGPEDRLERRLEFLHAQLRVTAAQERAWRSFAEVLRDEARDRARNDRFDGRDQFRGPPSVLERLDDRQRMLADRSANLDRIVRALRPLYASFSAEQKRTADRLMFMPGDGGRVLGDGGRGGQGFDRDGGRFGPGPDRDRDYRS